MSFLHPHSRPSRICSSSNPFTPQLFHNFIIQYYVKRCTLTHPCLEAKVVDILGQGSTSALAAIYTVLPGPFYTLEANNLLGVECPVSAGFTGLACWVSSIKQDGVSSPHPKLTHVLQTLTCRVSSSPGRLCEPVP